MIVVVFFVLFLRTNCEIVSWNFKHQTCSGEVDLRGKGVAPAHFNFTCKDSTYITYIRSVLAEARHLFIFCNCV